MTALKSLYSHHDVACELLDKGSFEEAGRELVNASVGIKGILLAEHPRTLGCLFDLLMYLRGRKRLEVGLIGAPAVLRAASLFRRAIPWVRSAAK